MTDDRPDSDFSRADLARELNEAPVVARPQFRAAEERPGPANDTPPPDDVTHDRPHGEIWDGCPVVPLGVNGEHSYYLDRLGQLRAVNKHDLQKIMHLFGDRLDLLSHHFPQWSVAKDGTATKRKGRFDQTSASMAMISACAERGLFNPDGSVRGTGAWRDDDGNLIYHCGNQLLTAQGARAPGEIDGKIYPAYPPVPAPAQAAGRSAPALEILDMLGRWNWEHAEVMPMVALGMIGAQMMSGALDWRPVYWLTGDKASGKSTFQDLLRHLHGGERGLVQSNDPTKSGITARLGHSSMPVALDEIEPDEEHAAKGKALIELARVAASGGQWLRGSADQKGAGGNVYSTFLFSSILIPGAMGAQDRSRLITMGLRPLEAGAAKLTLDARKLRGWGAVMKRHLIDRWPSWAERLELWRAALADAGLSGRNGDNWATTLAMADALLNEALPARDVLGGWAKKAARAAHHETEEIGSDAESMLMHLMGQPLDPWRRGQMYTLAQWVMVAARTPAAPVALQASCCKMDGSSMLTEADREAAAKAANEILASYGLRVRGVGDVAALFIPNARIPALAKLFERSTWAAGVWSQSAKRVIGAEPVAQPLTLAGQRTRGVYVPLRSIGGMMSFPMDRTPTQPGPVNSAAAAFDEGF